MKKTITLFVVCAIFSSIHAQSFKFGTIAADAGAGFGFYGIKSYSPINKESHDGIGIVGSLPVINAEFGIARFFGVGARYRTGTYGKSGTNKIRGNDILVCANFHIANKNERFDLPIGVGYGITSMKANLSGSEHLYGNGSIINIHVSPHFYFGKYIGMFLSLGYNKHILSTLEIQDSAGKVYTDADGATWNMGGVYFEFGIAGRFHLFNKESSSSATMKKN